MKLIGQKNANDWLFPIVILHIKNSVNWKTVQEALLLMRKHLIVKYGQSDLQYTSPHHVINKYSLKAQKKTCFPSDNAYKCCILQTKVKHREVKISHEHSEKNEKIEFNDGEL